MLDEEFLSLLRTKGPGLRRNMEKEFAKNWGKTRFFTSGWSDAVWLGWVLIYSALVLVWLGRVRALQPLQCRNEK